MTYQPSHGDHVTVTRHLPDGRTATWTGTIYPGPNGGFMLYGHTGDGTPVASAFAGADTMLRCHDVVQTVQPATD